MRYAQEVKNRKSVLPVFSRTDNGTHSCIKQKAGQSGQGQNGHFRFRKRGHLLTIINNYIIYI